MDLATYAVEAEVEASHWWFVGRRQLFSREIARLGLGSEARVLDIGTSTGTNLRMARDLGFARVSGLDFSEAAIAFCASKGLGTVDRGDICAMPYGEAAFDLVLATDVIEHVEDDTQALREIGRVLAAEGRALVSVPAFRSLWGLQDEVSQHKRRYRKAELRDRLRAAGLEPERLYYFNYLLFAPIWLARRLIRAASIDLQSENEVNSRPLNALLGWVFALDVATAPLIRPPFGVSILAVVRRAG